MRYLRGLALLPLPSCVLPPPESPTVNLTALPDGDFRASVRRTVEVGTADPGLLEQGCRRDVLRVALEEADKRGWRRPEVDERRIESFSGRNQEPITYWAASLGVSR